jgi:hypothetical protein
MKTQRYRLLINLGASQARKRLKGHGYGVKRIETAGKGQAVITHTATGRHLDELRALLFDVLSEPDETPSASSDGP